MYSTIWHPKMSVSAENTTDTSTPRDTDLFGITQSEQRNLTRFGRENDQGELRTAERADIYIDPTTKPVDPRELGPKFSA